MSDRFASHPDDPDAMQERCGLSVLEVVGLLADYLDRLGATPTKPREEAQRDAS